MIRRVWWNQHMLRSKKTGRRTDPFELGKDRTEEEVGASQHEREVLDTAAAQCNEDKSST